MTTVATSRPRTRSVQRSLWAGALVQTLCLVLPVLDVIAFGTIARHVQATYPHWSDAEVTLDRNAIVVGLAIVGVLGVVSWIVAALITRRGRFLRSTVTTMFLVGLLTATTVAGTGGGPYERFVPLWLGVTLLIAPLIPSIIALVTAWRSAAQSTRAGWAHEQT